MQRCLSRFSSSRSSLVGDGGVCRSLCFLRNLHGQAASAQPQHPPQVPPYTAKEIAVDPHFAELGRLPSEKIIRIADEMLSLSILEVSDVADLLKKKLKITNMPMVGFGFAGGAAPAGSQPVEEKKPEKMTFDVKLEKFDAAAKIKIIKEIRSFTTLGLKEAKELVEKAPAVVKTGISKEEATDIVAKLKALGATVVME
ncbi:hypothetical protein GOP47_0028736 [Adiantum capillus-veneris]|nr:hypothetical protein GOP47_0028736 [Adiantum capillus-veneris]